MISQIAFKSRAGNSPGGARKTNQDSFLSKTSILGLDEFSIFAVFDGHGQNGHLASQFIKSYISDYFTNISLYSLGTKTALTEEYIYERLIENNYERLRLAFVTAEKQLAKSKFDVNFSGSTAVTLILIGKFLVLIFQVKKLFALTLEILEVFSLIVVLKKLIHVKLNFNIGFRRVCRRKKCRSIEQRP